MAYVRTHLGRLFCEEHGASKRSGDPAIVLLHGLLFDGGMWRDQIAPLATLGRVLVVDGPGHGRSELARGFTLEQHADSLADALRELGVAHAIVVGLSWGGMVAMRLALRQPSLVAGLALLDTSAEREPIGNRWKYRAFVAVHRRIGTPYALFERQIAPLMFADSTLSARPDLVRRTYERAMGFDREAVAQAAIAVVVERTNVLPELPRVRAPTLVMCGALDRATPPEKSRAIARAIPGAELVVIDGVGHMAPLEDAGAVNARLAPFVGRCIEGAARTGA